MDYVEGPSVYTYPFGRVDGAIQLLIDADQITQGVAVITALRFRPSQQTQTVASYTKNYQVTAYTVATAAAQMVADLGINTGSATGTVVFLGPLTLPAAGPLAVQPAPFSIAIPFQAPYVFDGTQGNLLLLVETADQGPVTGTYRIDAVQFRSNTITGLVAPIDLQGCTAGGAGLTSSTAEANAILGGGIVTTVTSSLPGAFPSVLTALSFSRRDIDLGPLGMPGCTARIGPDAFLVLLEVGGAYPPATWGVPATPALEAAAVLTQSVGLTAAGLLGAVVSNAEAIRIGSNQSPTPRTNTAFRAGAGWFIGNAGEFAPVVQLEGAFP